MIKIKVCALQKVLSTISFLWFRETWGIAIWVKIETVSVKAQCSLFADINIKELDELHRYLHFNMSNRLNIDRDQ